MIQENFGFKTKPPGGTLSVLLANNRSSGMVIEVTTSLVVNVDFLLFYLMIVSLNPVISSISRMIFQKIGQVLHLSSCR